MTIANAMLVAALVSFVGHVATTFPRLSRQARWQVAMGLFLALYWLFHLMGE
jgi:hypothetical protein